MNIENIKNLLYDLYKENWMYENVPAAERLDVFREYTTIQLTEDQPYKSFDEYISDNGYRGSLYVCKDEFLQNEYQDREYIQNLLEESGINVSRDKIMKVYDMDLQGELKAARIGSLQDLAAYVSDQLMQKHFSAEPREKTPKDSRAFAWLQSDIEYLLVNTELTTNDIKEEIGIYCENVNTDPEDLFIVINFDKAERSAEIRRDFAKALDQVEYGFKLSGDLDYGFSKRDIEKLAILHRDQPKYREKIEDLLEDCNFHTECGDFADGNYGEYVNEPEEEKEI